MKRSITHITAIALVALLVFPTMVSAKGKPEHAGKPNVSAQSGKHAQQQDAKAARSAERETRKQAHAEQKAQAAAERDARKAEHKAARTGDSSESAEASESAEGTPSVGNAFTRITANLQKSLAKIAAGKKTQLPPGLVRVWLKFASWLGVDPTTMPGAVSVSPDPPTGETTPTAEPTGTVTPPSTQPPTSTVTESEVLAP